MLWNGEVKGVALRVTPGGAKSFILDYRAEERQRRITIPVGVATEAAGNGITSDAVRLDDVATVAA